MAPLNPAPNRSTRRLWAAGPTRLVPSAGRVGGLRPGFHLEPGMRVGLFGGSFNPAHDGHAHVAETALRRLGLDRIVWLVSPQNPLKSARDLKPVGRRLADALREARGPSMIVTDVETRLGARYTIDTVRLLKGRFPGVRFVWVMGSDSLAGFHTWRGWTRLMHELPIAVVARPGTLLSSRTAPAARRFADARLPAGQERRLVEAAAPAWLYLAAPLNEASSTAIRAGATTRGTAAP